MKTVMKLSVLFFLSCLVFSCSSNDEDDVSDCETCAYTVVSGETETSVPAGLIGVFNVTLDTSVNGYAFAKGTKATFTIAAKQLTVEIDGQECITIKNPILVNNGRSIIFRDSCRDNVHYNVGGPTSTSLNEINVITLGGLFYASFK